MAPGAEKGAPSLGDVCVLNVAGKTHEPQNLGSCHQGVNPKIASGEEISPYEPGSSRKRLERETGLEPATSSLEG